MKLILQEFVSVDGVSQGPGGPDEDTSGGFTRGGWFVPFLDERFIEIIEEWVGHADAFLFGRKTYRSFARDWPRMDNPDDPVATALDHLEFRGQCTYLGIVPCSERLGFNILSPEFSNGCARCTNPGHSTLFPRLPRPREQAPGTSFAWPG